MFSLTGLLLVLVGAQNVYGQDVQVTLDKDCYEKNIDTSMTLTATYTGSDTFDAVIWFFSGKNLQNIIVDTGCSVFQSDTGYPLARMTYKCPPNTSDSNTYQLILSNLVESDLGSSDWGATFQVATTANPVVMKKTPELCQTPTVVKDGCPGLGNSTAVDSTAECTCAWIGISCSIILGIIIIGMVIELKSKQWGTLGNAAKIVSRVFIIGFGFWICWAIRGKSESCQSDAQQANVQPLRGIPVKHSG